MLTQKKEDREKRLTNEENESAREHAAKDGHDDAARGDKLLVEVAEHWNAEALKDVVDVEETGEHLRKVAHHIWPAHWTRVAGINEQRMWLYNRK